MIDASIARVTLNAARELGLKAEHAEEIASSERRVLLLEPCTIVAKVAPASELSRFTAEVQVAAHVQRRRGPVVPPLLRAEPGPYLRGQWVISFWEYAPSEVEHETLELAAVPAYVELLRHLADFPGRLPRFTEVIQGCREALARGRVQGLSHSDLELLESALALVDALELAEGDLRVLHGDPHARNLTRTYGETLWLDLESVCTGPVE